MASKWMEDLIVIKKISNDQGKVLDLITENQISRSPKLIFKIQKCNQKIVTLAYLGLQNNPLRRDKIQCQKEMVL